MHTMHYVNQGAIIGLLIVINFTLAQILKALTQ